MRRYWLIIYILGVAMLSAIPKIAMAQTQDTAFAYFLLKPDSSLLFNTQYAYGVPLGEPITNVQIIDKPTDVKAFITANTYLSCTLGPSISKQKTIMLEVAVASGAKIPLKVIVEPNKEDIEEGNEFYVYAPAGIRYAKLDKLHQYVRVMTSMPSRIVITNSKNAEQIVDIDCDTIVDIESSIVEAVSHVISSAPILLQGLRKEDCNEDIANIWPINQLGCDYMISAPGTYSVVFEAGVAVVGTKNNTRVSIFSPQGLEKTIKLDAGQKYERLDSTEHFNFSGYRIQSDKPVAVFVGAESQLGTQDPAMDYSYTSPLPVSSLGTEYIVARWNNNRIDDYVEFIAVNDNTTLTINGGIHILQSQEFKRFHLNNDTTVIFASANHPVSCNLFVAGQNIHELDGYGDASQCLILPTNRMTSFSKFALNYTAEHPSLMIISPTETASATTFCGKPIATFHPVPGKEEFSYANVPLENEKNRVFEIANNDGVFNGFVLSTKSWDCASQHLPTMRNYKWISTRTRVRFDTLFVCPTTAENEEYITYEEIDMLRLVQCSDTLEIHTIQQLVKLPTSRKVIFDTICAGDLPYTWHGKQYNKFGNFYDTAHIDCYYDSIYQLRLVERKVKLKADTTICASALPLTWYGHEFAQAGSYTQHWGQTTCDSTRTLTLTVNPVQEGSASYKICIGSFVTVNGQKYTAAGEYKQTLVGTNGCDSILTITITVEDCSQPDPGHDWGDHPLNPYIGCDTTYSVSYKQIREEELPYVWNINTVTAVPANEGRDTTLIFTTTNAAACDSIATLHLHILDACEPAAIYLPEEWGNNVK